MDDRKLGLFNQHANLKCTARNSLTKAAMANVNEQRLPIELVSNGTALATTLPDNALCLKRHRSGILSLILVRTHRFDKNSSASGARQSWMARSFLFWVGLVSDADEPPVIDRKGDASDGVCRFGAQEENPLRHVLR